MLNFIAIIPIAFPLTGVSCVWYISLHSAPGLATSARRYISFTPEFLSAPACSRLWTQIHSPPVQMQIPSPLHCTPSLVCVITKLNWGRKWCYDSGGEISPTVDYWLLFSRFGHDQGSVAAWQVCGGNLLMVILFSDCKTTKAQNAPRVCAICPWLTVVFIFELHLSINRTGDPEIIPLLGPLSLYKGTAWELFCPE